MDLPFGFEKEYARERVKIKKSFNPKMVDYWDTEGCVVCRARLIKRQHALRTWIIIHNRLNDKRQEEEQRATPKMYQLLYSTVDTDIKKTEEALIREEVEVNTVVKYMLAHVRSRRSVLEAHKRVRAAMWKLHECRAKKQRPFIMWYQSTR